MAAATRRYRAVSMQLAAYLDDRYVELLRVQPEGDVEMDAEAFLAGQGRP